MRNIITLIIIAGLAWYGYTKYQSARHPAPERATPPIHVEGLKATASESTTSFKCDGRTYCSQMTSCEEATYFLQNCPGTKMDGNNDGVPCERQWCK